MASTTTETDKGGEVYTRQTCPHVLQCVTMPASIDVFPNLSQSTQCSMEKCDHTESWVCVACHQILCGRYGAQHMLEHKNTHSHLIAMGCGDLSFWCYGCDDYLDHLRIARIFEFYKLAHVSKFGHEIESLDLLLKRTQFEEQNKLEQQLSAKEWFVGTEILRRKYAKKDAIEYDSDPEHKQKGDKPHTHSGVIIKVTKKALGGGKLMVKDENGAYCNYDLLSIRIKLPPATAENTISTTAIATAKTTTKSSHAYNQDDKQPPIDDDADDGDEYRGPIEFVPFERAKSRHKAWRKNTVIEYYIDADGSSDYAVHKASIVSVAVDKGQVTLQCRDDGAVFMVTHAMAEVRIGVPSLFWQCRRCQFDNAGKSTSCMVCGMLGVEMTADSQRPSRSTANVRRAASVHHFFVYGTLRDDDDSGASWTQPWVQGCTAQSGQVCGYKMYQRRGQNFPFAVQTGNASDAILGRIVTWNDGATVHEKQKHADRIEGYTGDAASFYHRTVVDADVLHGNFTANGPQRVKSFLYYQDIPNDAHVSCKEIPNGDWLQRDKK